MEKSVESKSNKKIVENSKSTNQGAVVKKKSNVGTKSAGEKRAVASPKTSEKKESTKASSTSMESKTKNKKTATKTIQNEKDTVAKTKIATKTAGTKTAVKSVETSKKKVSAGKQNQGEEQKNPEKKASTRVTSSSAKVTSSKTMKDTENKNVPNKKSQNTSRVKKTDENEKTPVVKKTSTNAKSSASVKKAVPKASEKVLDVKEQISKKVEKVSSEKSGQIKINKSDNVVAEYEKELNINFLEDELEEKFDLDELDKKLKERKKLSKKEGFSIIKNSFYNLIFACVFIYFLIFCNYGFYNIAKTAMIKNLNIFSVVFLVVSIMLIETAYKEDKASKCINGIETLLVGIFTLVLPFILQTYTENYIKALSIAGITILVYYIIKSVIVFFLNKRDVLRDKDDVAKEKDENELDDDYDD